MKIGVVDTIPPVDIQRQVFAVDVNSWTSVYYSLGRTFHHQQVVTVVFLAVLVNRDLSVIFHVLTFDQLP